MRIYQIISYEADNKTVKDVEFAESSAEAIAKAVSYHKDGVKAEAVQFDISYTTFEVSNRVVLYD